MSEFDTNVLEFRRLKCGCVVLVTADVDGVRLMRRVADKPTCGDFPRDDRFHCWRMDGSEVVRLIPINEVASTSGIVQAGLQLRPHGTEKGEA